MDDTAELVALLADGTGTVHLDQDREYLLNTRTGNSLLTSRRSIEGNGATFKTTLPSVPYCAILSLGAGPDIRDATVHALSGAYRKGVCSLTLVMPTDAFSPGG